MRFLLRRVPSCRNGAGLPESCHRSIRIPLTHSRMMSHSPSHLQQRRFLSSAMASRTRFFYRSHRSGIGHLSQNIRGFRSSPLAAVSDGSSAEEEDTVVTWSKIREGLEGTMSSEELAQCDEMFKDLPAEGIPMGQLREQVGRNFVLDAAGIDLEVEGEPDSDLDWVKAVLRKDATATDGTDQVPEEEAQMFSQFLVAAMTGDMNAVMNKPDKESIDASLARFGIQSRRPISMFHEAVWSFLKRNDTVAHFEQWSDKAMALLDERSIGSDASVQEIEAVLQGAGLLDEALDTLPNFNPSPDADEEQYQAAAKDIVQHQIRRDGKDDHPAAARLRRDYYAYYLSQGRQDEFLELLLEGVDREDEDMKFQVAEVEKLFKTRGPQIIAADEASLDHNRLMTRLKEHVSKNGSEELTKLAMAVQEMDQSYIADQGLMNDAKEPEKSRDDNRGRRRGDDDEEEDDDKLWDQSYGQYESELEPEEAVAAMEAKKEHMEGPHGSEGWILKEWMLWKEARGETVEHDPADPKSWLEVGQPAGHGTYDLPEEHRVMHPMEFDDLFLHTTTRRQLHRVFELYDDVTKHAIEIEKKRPADDILALRAQPPEFLGDARLRYTYRDDLHVLSHELETHPGQRTVKLRVNLNHLPLDEKEKTLMKDLTGPRYNAASGDLTLTSRKFQHRLQNRIHVRLLLDRVMQEAKKAHTQ